VNPASSDPSSGHEPDDWGLPRIDVVIPDDARELDHDLEIWRREERWRHRRERLATLFQTRRWRRYGMSGPLVVTILLVVALFGSLLALLGPRTLPLVSRPIAAPVGQATAPPGKIGGLLPDVTLTTASGDVSARDLRPSVLVLVPPGCACGEKVAALVGQANEYRLPVYLVGAPAQAGQLDNLATISGRGVPVVVTDPAGGLAVTYSTSTSHPTLVLVHSDAVVTSVIHNFAVGNRLEPLLGILAQPGGLATS
jgi:hypothetical protein